MPAAIVSSIAGRPSWRGGDLDEQVRAVDERRAGAWPRRSCASVSCARFGSTSSETQPSLPLALVPDGAQDVAGVADVVARRARGRSPWARRLGARDLADLVVVGVALGDRALEDRRVGGDADDALVDQRLRGRRPRRTGATGSRSRRSGRGRRAAGGGCWPCGSPRAVRVFVPHESALPGRRRGALKRARTRCPVSGSARGARRARAARRRRPARPGAPRAAGRRGPGWRVTVLAGARAADRGAQRRGWRRASRRASICPAVIEGIVRKPTSPDAPC